MMLSPHPPQGHYNHNYNRDISIFYSNYYYRYYYCYYYHYYYTKNALNAFAHSLSDHIT